MAMATTCRSAMSLSAKKSWMMMLFSCTSTICFQLAVVVFALGDANQDCDENIYSDRMQYKSGELVSPAVYGPNLRCIYQLIGRPNERVSIKFVEFEVKGVLPRCQADYIDVYTQVREPFQNLLTVPLHGRYCGLDTDRLPQQLISMTNILVIGFYTDSSDKDGHGGFRIAYQFIDDTNYNVGTPAPSNVCGQTIRTLSSGVLLSPTFPGMYPDKITCYYKILGVPGQRVKLTFLEIDLYAGGEHCPFDFIKIYDGPTNEYPVINIYCGTLFNVQVFSTNESLRVEFVTKSGRAEATKKTYLTYDEKAETEVQRKGFNATFVISDSFFNLDYIQGYHVRGTECDQIIYSGGETNGTIMSPYYPNPYPVDITCIYYVDGLQDKQNLEKVELEVEDIDIPKSGIGCSNGYLRAFLKGQEPKPDAMDYDQEFCGKSTTVRKLTTSKPRLLLIFSASGSQTGRGFKAKYQFVTDYAIEGTPATSSVSQCHYIYRSTSSKHGTFTSPRHPSYYPDRTHCLYEFLGGHNEQVRITFEYFRLENGYPQCLKDSVRIYNVVPHKPDVLIGQYCGDKLPGPQMSDENSNSLKVVLSTNEEGVKQGFRARYEFVEKTEEKRCVYNITNLTGGVIKSPNYPYKYYTNRTCDWYIYSRRKDGIILLIFDKFEMEGNPDTTGCGNAALKIFANISGMPTAELCGSNKSLTDWTIQSQNNLLHIKFISSAKAVGGKGFTIWWTDVISGPRLNRGGRCSGFLCKTSHFCISSDLKCNKQKNCGYGDESDEQDCRTYRPQSALNIILGVVLTLVAVIVVIVIIIHRRRKMQQQENKKKEIEVRYMTRSASEDRDGACGGSGTGTGIGSRDAISLNSGHNLFREQTEKVSIV